MGKWSFPTYKVDQGYTTISENIMIFSENPIKLIQDIVNSVKVKSYNKHLILAFREESHTKITWT